MEIHIERTEESLIIGLTERLDTNTAPELKKALEGATEGAKEVVFQLSKLEYISSAGLAIFTKLGKDMKKQDGKIVVCGANTRVITAFKTTGLNKFLDFQD